MQTLSARLIVGLHFEIFHGVVQTASQADVPHCIRHAPHRNDNLMNSTSVEIIGETHGSVQRYMIGESRRVEHARNDEPLFDVSRIQKQSKICRINQYEFIMLSIFDFLPAAARRRRRPSADADDLFFFPVPPPLPETVTALNPDDCRATTSSIVSHAVDVFFFSNGTSSLFAVPSSIFHCTNPQASFRYSHDSSSSKLQSAA